MKDAIRKQILEIRKKLDIKQIEEKSKTIINKLHSLGELNNSKIIHCFMSNNNEVKTLKLIKTLCSNKTVIIPPYKTLDIENSKQNIDVVIVPGIVFDKAGNRIGYGKGCYDQFLKDITAVKIALAYDFQIVDKISTEEHDIKMDYIVTEKRIIRCKNA